MERLTGIARELNDLFIQVSRLEWAHFTTGFDFGVVQVHEKIQEKFQDKRSWDVIQSLRMQDLPPEDARRVQIMEQLFKPYHLSDELNRISLAITEKTNELSSVLNTHRCRVKGRELSSPEIARILATEPDREIRKEAFLSRSQVSSPLVEAGFIQLLDLRKEFARQYGAGDYVEYQLEQQELQPSIFDSWQEDLGSVLPLMKRIRSDFSSRLLGDDEVMPWDETYISGKIAPELNSHVNMADFFTPVRDLFGEFGFDISEMNITYDVFPRRNKSEWGYNFPIENGVDSRILANVRDRFAEFGVLLHETGHALHSFVLNPHEIIMNMGVSGIVSEGIANLFGGFQLHRKFYSKFFEEDPQSAHEHFRELRLWSIAGKLRSVRRILFDQSLYRNSITSLDDIHQLIWRSHREILGEEPYAEVPVWANTIHYTTHPIYLHNYLLGDVTCEMLEGVFLKRDGLSDVSDDPKGFGRFLLDEVMKVSGRYSFPDLYRRICGEEISLEFLLARLKREADSLAEKG